MPIGIRYRYLHQRLLDGNPHSPKFANYFLSLYNYQSCQSICSTKFGIYLESDALKSLRTVALVASIAAISFVFKLPSKLLLYILKNFKKYWLFSYDYCIYMPWIWLEPQHWDILSRFKTKKKYIYLEHFVAHVLNSYKKCFLYLHKIPLKTSTCLHLKIHELYKKKHVLIP